MDNRDYRHGALQDPGRDQDLDAVQADFDAAYAGNEKAFKKALLGARDYLGQLLARTWSGLQQA